MSVNGTQIPGLVEITAGRIYRGPDGQPEITTTIRPAGQRRPGRRLLWGAVWFLAALAGTSFFVSYAAQFRFVFAVKQVFSASAAEALIPDAGMAICALLALAMAVQGRPATATRAAVVGFAALSAVMNYAAADPSSARSVLVYVMPPVTFAVCTDLVVSAVRRFYYGVEDGKSPWRVLGRGLLWVLRLVLAPVRTPAGLRRMVLDATPLPQAGEPAAREERLPDAASFGSKTAALLHAYERHADRGDRSKVGPVATELAPWAGLTEGGARTILYRHLDRQAS
jgi:Protein of unknown function (DUF2637)